VKVNLGYNRFAFDDQDEIVLGYRNYKRVIPLI
jgi:hypothetical protein